MTSSFSDKHVVVTGGRSGIGKACVELFESHGAIVHVLDAADRDHPDDVTDERAVEAFFDAVARPPDVLVNGAGTGTAVRLVDMPLSEWRRVLSVNLDGTFLCLRAAARRMVEGAVPGAIVNISSINERWPLTGFGPYCASKAGVKMLTEVAAVELGEHGIRVNSPRSECGRCGGFVGVGGFDGVGGVPASGRGFGRGAHRRLWRT
jgi:3-oxoacyl-[acyl-carrier protein] reductase